GIAEPSRSEERLLEQEQIEQARAALHQLTSLQQQVIVLRFLQGMSNVEIAEVIQKNVGAVKALQHRALNALRRIIQEKENET
ncbi:MAG: sigma-70 family RNA polymerase sigma factor, partial [Anaerolineae bacterium]|nr:sigma-70 family RNA polymerase sigma factor [Anaerolineae bacterium]